MSERLDPPQRLFYGRNIINYELTPDGTKPLPSLYEIARYDSRQFLEHQPRYQAEKMMRIFVGKNGLGRAFCEEAISRVEHLQTRGDLNPLDNNNEDEIVAMRLRSVAVLAEAIARETSPAHAYSVLCEDRQSDGAIDSVASVAVDRDYRTGMLFVETCGLSFENYVERQRRHYVEMCESAVNRFV